jgi:hypothetical protein
MAFVDALVSETPARALLQLMAQPLGVVPIRRWADGDAVSGAAAALIRAHAHI